jgi:hypothetical protein
MGRESNGYRKVNKKEKKGRKHLGVLKDKQPFSWSIKS